MTEVFVDTLPVCCQLSPRLRPLMQAWRSFATSAEDGLRLLELLEDIGEQEHERYKKMSCVVTEAAFEAEELQRRIAEKTLECSYSEERVPCPNWNC